MAADPRPRRLDPDLHLPVTLLARYLFFLSRRPISRSNAHFLRRRLDGLRSLVPLLAGRDAELEAIAGAVAALTPGSFARLVDPLLARLEPWVRRDLPADILVARRPPPPRWLFDGVRRVRLALAPGIGIGDEILCFPLARWLRARLGGGDGGVEIEVLSAYRDLWQRVAAVDTVRAYRGHAELVAAMRDGDAGDLLLTIDFEKPALSVAMTYEPTVRRYAELALGARSMTVYHAGDRQLHRTASTRPYLRNHYDALAHFAAWLGAPSPRDDRDDRWTGTLRPRPARADSERDDADADVDAGTPGPGPRLLIAPFTSKHDPSTVWWSRLAAAALPAANGDGEILFDPGPNLSTERLASELVRATRALAPQGVRCRVAVTGAGRTASLAEIMAWMDTVDVVICADSFAAHAAPLFGCLTLVVASAGLEDWRASAPRSFYFDDAWPRPALARAMRRLIAAAGLVPPAGGVASAPPWRPPAGDCLVTASDHLADRLADPAAELDALRQAYGELGERLRTVIADLDAWPEALRALLADRPYPRLLPPVRHRAAADPDLRLHLRSHLASWRNSNVCKYLRLVDPTLAGGMAR